jgi:murein DD-endopeptidase MepM/ murein hydrolase activator NlpD
LPVLRAARYLDRQTRLSGFCVALRARGGRTPRSLFIDWARSLDRRARRVGRGRFLLSVSGVPRGTESVWKNSPGVDYYRRVRLLLALLFIAWVEPVAAQQPRRKPVTVRRYWRPPVVIPDHYIVRPQLSDLPPLQSPLAGLELRELSDSFAYRRYDGPIHWGIDIFRPWGETVTAVAEGTVHLAQMPKGGTAIFLTDATGDFRFYYAHLSAYAPNLRDGDWVKVGDAIGYIGDTGNAKGTRPHLHFEIHMLAPWLIDEGGVMRGRAAVLNPCPILRDLVAQQKLR